MRLVLSEGQVNIFNLAKNAGTSVEQIERFYARNLPMSAEMARNLQSFGGEDWVLKFTNMQWNDANATHTNMVNFLIIYKDFSANIDMTAWWTADFD